MDDYYQNHFSEERIIEDRFIEDIDWWNLVHNEKFELLITLTINLKFANHIIRRLAKPSCVHKL